MYGTLDGLVLLQHQGLDVAATCTVYTGALYKQFSVCTHRRMLIYREGQCMQCGKQVLNNAWR